MTKWNSACYNLQKVYFSINKLNTPCEVSTYCMKSKGCQFKNSFTVTMNCTLWKKWCMQELISDKTNNYSSLNKYDLTAGLEIKETWRSHLSN